MNTAAPLISFVLPFYRKLEWLRTVFPRNACFQSPQVEVVLVLDEPSQETEVLAFVREQPVRVQVIVNDKDHPWRPPCAAINVGIRHARGVYTAVVSPESYLLVEPDYLEQKVLILPERFILCGRLWHGVGITPETPLQAVEDYARQQRAVSDLYGFKCCATEHWMEAGGYDEHRQKYGGDDDDVFHRLCAVGGCYTGDPHIRIVHPYHASADRVEGEREPYAQQVEFAGRQFSRVAHDYAHVAQLAEPRASNANVAGSSPVVCSTL